MFPRLNNPSIVNRINPISILNSRQPMSDPDHRVLLIHALDGLLHFLFQIRVEIARRLV